MPRPRSADRDQVLGDTRQRLLEAALAEFARQGYIGANINRISMAAGFAKGTIYNHFASKEALMLALVDQIAARHTALVVEQVRVEDEPTRRLERFFRAGFEFIEDNPATAMVIVQAIYGPERAFKERVYAAYAGLQALIGQEIVAPGVARGDFRAVELEPTIALIMSVYWGSCSMLEPGGRFQVTAGQAVRFVLDGLRR